MAPPSLIDFLRPLEQRIEDLEGRVIGVEDQLQKALALLSRLDSITSTPAELPVRVIPTVREGEYTFKPLKDSEIRVILVHPSANESGPLHCELQHISLDDDADFRTLSYTWGDTNRNGSIRIDGQHFPVTANLEAAMRRLRSLSPEPTFWWIDAISINQADVLERNTQVELMTRIYKNAIGMQIWLGEAANDSDLAMDLARRVGDTTPRGPGERELAYPIVTGEQRARYWKALVALFDRPWWERVWVRQEVALGKEVDVLCGSAACHFGALTTTLDILTQMDKFGLAPAASFARALELAKFRLGMGQRPNPSFRDLLELVPHTRACKATDPRDKLFSLFGLIDPNYWKLAVDYRLPMVETFRLATAALITKQQSLDILSACQNVERRDGLPSWIPHLVADWRATPFSRQPHWGEVPVGPDVDFAIDDRTALRAHGRRIDHIGRICETVVKPETNDEELDAISLTWKEFAFATLKQTTIGPIARGSINLYKQDLYWITFLSAGKDRGGAPTHATPVVSTRGNYQMATSMLLSPENPKSAAIEGARMRIREYLRKYGVGRVLCHARPGPKKGMVGLAPANIEEGDEVWLFRGTSLPYVLRRDNDGRRRVVGEICEYSAL